MQFIRLVLLGAAAAILAGCTTSPIKDAKAMFQSKSEQMLSAGIDDYEEGRYPEASKNLHGALDAGLSSKADQVKAHKYLAFIHCVSGREKQCRDEFRKALEINPNLELEPAEAGHPGWGPVFRSVKGRK